MAAGRPLAVAPSVDGDGDDAPGHRTDGSSRSGRRAGLRRALVALLVLSAVGFVVAPSIRTATRTALLVPELLGLSVRPLSAVAPEPRRVTIAYGTPHPDRLDLYVPGDARPGERRPAVVLELGIHPQPLDHPDVVEVASAIARTGVVVAVPDSTALRESRVEPTEAGRLADAILVVASRPEVDAGRVGVAGFSAGASVALLAAADPRVADRLRYVSAYGGYADAAALLVDVASRTAVVEGSVTPWSPEPGVRGDVLRLVMATLDPPTRDRLRAALEPVVAAETAPTGPDPVIEATLEGEALSAYRIFTAASRHDAEAALASAPRLGSHLASISPTTSAAHVRAPVFVMHGLSDTSIPASHAAMLVRALPPGTVARVTLFGRFGHIQPGKDGIGLEDVPDVWRLAAHLAALVSSATE